MKQVTIYTLTILLLMSLASCESAKKERLVTGRWSYSSSFADNLNDKKLPEGSVTTLLESIDEFCADNKEKEFGSYQIFFNLYLDESDTPYTVILEYDTDYQGTWSVDGNDLVLKGDYCTYQFSKGYALDPTADYDEEYYVNLVHSYADTAIIEPLIDTMMAEHRAEIFELTSESLTLKYEGHAAMQTLTKVKKPTRNEP
ncbi:MAG: hypothetical protein J5720_00730 [Bacteroidaceae bacterium]|nr:hypothetical protein [Bacteroidaceae bacterium]